VVLETVDVVELDDRRKVIGELSECGADFLARQSRCDLLENHVALGGDQLVVCLLESRDRHELATPRVPLLVLTQNAAQNPVEPGPHLRSIAQIIEAQPSAAARVLYRVLGIGADGRSSCREREKAVEMWKHERFEALVPVRDRSENLEPSQWKRTYCR
jgi:hypothetical protein